MNDNRKAVLLSLLAILVVVLVAIFYEDIKNFFKPTRPTQFLVEDNAPDILKKFPQDLILDLKEVKGNRESSYVNQNQATANQYEITYTSSRKFDKLVFAYETYFLTHGYPIIYKEEAMDGKVQIRHGKKPNESLVVQIEKTDSLASLVNVIFTH